MLRATLAASSAAVALLLTACGPQENQAQQQAQSELATKPAPNAAERTAAEAANEVEQLASPDTEFTPAELAAGINAADVPNAQSTLSTAAVKTSGGQALGEVRSVTIGSNGKADAVVVEVGGFLNVGEHPVSIEAKKFTYLKDRNILVAAVTKTEVEKMPVATSQ